MERLWSRTQRTGAGCLEWQGGTDSHGYGSIYVDGRNRGAHRVAFEAAHGPIPVGLVVRHRCDNRRCVEPAHLVIGTPADNVRDAVERSRRPLGIYAPGARLTDADIETIRVEYATGRANQPQLAVRFGCTQAHISRVVLGSVRTQPSRRGANFRPASEVI